MKNEKLKKLSLNLRSDNPNYMDNFRRNIDMYVNEKDITLREISEVADMPFETLKNFLYKDSKDCKLSTAVKLAKAFNVSIDELIGAETLHPLTKESVAICRNLPDNDLMLVRWFIRCLSDLNSRNEPNKRYVSVMLPELDNNGDCKLISKFEKMEITDLKEPLRSKIFIGFKIVSDYYMPYYMPGDIVLIANDRPAKPNEHAVVRTGDYIFIVKRILESGTAKLYSVRDEKYRIDEKDVDETIGYVTFKISRNKNQ